MLGTALNVPAIQAEQNGEPDSLLYVLAEQAGHSARRFGKVVARPRGQYLHALPELK